MEPSQAKENGNHMAQIPPGNPEASRRAQQLYDTTIRPKVETPENIGKILVLEPESGDYEIDEMGIETSFRLQARHPGARLYGFRIGYKAVEAFGGVLERTAP
jgi:hypothetical protein